MESGVNESGGSEKGGGTTPSSPIPSAPQLTISMREARTIYQYSFFFLFSPKGNPKNRQSMHL